MFGGGSLISLIVGTKNFLCWAYTQIEIDTNTADLYMGIQNNSKYRYLGQNWKWWSQSYNKLMPGKDRFLY